MMRVLLKNFVIRKTSPVAAVNGLKLQFFCSSAKLSEKICATINEEQKTVDLTIQNENTASKNTLKFPFIWLRDNCKCEKCHHSDSSSRIINWEKFDMAVKPKTILYDEQSDKLKIEWNDATGHLSEYEYDWLNDRNFSEENRKRYLDKFYRPSKTMLSKNSFLKELEYFDFQKVLDDDCELYKWLVSMIKKGVAIIINVPETENEVRKVANRIAFIRRTHYGEEFIVKAKEGTSNVAYLSENLQMHTDLPYYDYAPGANLLHCLVQSKSIGAENLLTDGFYVAQKMREEHREDFEILSKTLVNWTDVGQEENNKFHTIYRAPMVCLDYEGNITRINHSIPQRDSFFSVPLTDVQSWYKALGKFVELIHEESIEMKTKEGTMLCFDNSRLIHGRRKYEDSKENRRHVIGAYLDWDEIYSRYRVLQNKFKM